MVKKFFSYISKQFFLIFLRLNFKKNKFNNFKDLNFKQQEFINYKLIKHYIFKDDFIKNSTIRDVHTFNFLFYYQKLGGKKGIDLSKKNIFLWFDKYKFYNEFPWTDDLVAKRYLNLIYNYDFIFTISTVKEIKKLNFLINFHEKRFLFDFKRKKNEELSSIEIVALVLIKCIHNDFSKYFMNKIEEIINSQIDEIFMHKSYNILEHAKFVNNLNEIKNIMLFFNIKSPVKINNQILAMTSLLSRYKHDDFSLPLFNGCNNNHNNAIQDIVDKEQFLKSRALNSFVNGIAIYKDAGKTIFFDVVQPTRDGFSRELSAGSLSIEISAGGEKLITNCGGAESSGSNPSYLKYSAAHSTLIVNNTNISEVKELKKEKIFLKKVKYDRKENEDEIILIGTHNGYLKNYRKICKREIFVNKKLNIIKGNDTIISSNSKFEKTIYHIRFHIMPNISPTITENKKSIIMKTNNHNIWIFKSSSDISLEKSIYVENDIARETSQIVINGVTSSIRNKIKWSLEKI